MKAMKNTARKSLIAAIAVYGLAVLTTTINAQPATSALATATATANAAKAKIHADLAKAIAKLKRDAMTARAKSVVGDDNGMTKSALDEMKRKAWGKIDADLAAAIANATAVANAAKAKIDADLAEAAKVKAKTAQGFATGKLLPAAEAANKNSGK
jgi:hypothetical protein